MLVPVLLLPLSFLTLSLSLLLLLPLRLLSLQLRLLLMQESFLLRTLLVQRRLGLSHVHV